MAIHGTIRQTWYYSPEEGFTLRLKPFGLLPESARGHVLAAKREWLLALRSVIDEAVARVEERGRAPRRPRKVEVKGEEGPTAE